MKTKADILIVGNLLCINDIRSMWGGVICHCPLRLLEENFDTSEAITIHGDVSVESFDAKDKVVVVTNAISTKGGGYGS